MKYGYYADNEIPKSVALDRKPIADYKTNSHGYRCPEWSPLPDGKKNVVILGCSHTFGEGLDDGDVWVDQLYEQVDKQKLRFWNLGQPGASPDKCVRILYGSEKVLFPKIIIVCWPFWSRRERLDTYPKSLMSYDETLKTENENTDRNNFLKNVFFVEKFAEKANAKVFHCFAQDVYEIPNATHVFSKTSIKLCWPEWSPVRSRQEQRVFTSETSLAKDGVHYGIEHHRTFAREFYNYFKSKLK
jgi:hypothetical protein